MSEFKLHSEYKPTGDQPQAIDHPLRHAVFEYRPHQKHNRYQRGNGQNFFQHEDSPYFSAASKMAFSS
jgi:excinuclease UvrABC helicase subunit UvrB